MASGQHGTKGKTTRLGRAPKVALQLSLAAEKSLTSSSCATCRYQVVPDEQPTFPGADKRPLGEEELLRSIRVESWPMSSATRVKNMKHNDLSGVL